MIVHLQRIENLYIKDMHQLYQGCQGYFSILFVFARGFVLRVDALPHETPQNLVKDPLSKEVRKKDRPPNLTAANREVDPFIMMTHMIFILYIQKMQTFIDLSRSTKQTRDRFANIYLLATSN